MTRALWLLTALSALPSLQAAPTDPVVQLRIGVYVQRSGGLMGGYAGGEANGIGTPSTTWLDLSSSRCSLGAGGEPAGTNAIIWRSIGRIVGRVGNDYAIELDVTRNSGQMSEPPVHQRTVALGERVLIDQMSIDSGPCSGRTVRLEASVELAGVPVPGFAVGPGAPSRALAGAGRAGGVVVNPNPATFITNEFMHLGEGPTERSYLEGNALRGARSIPIELHSVQASYRAELWLVYTAPDGTQRTLELTGNMDESGTSFRFDAFPIRVVNRPALAYIAANLRPMATDAGRQVLRAVIARVIDGATAGAQGASSRAVSMPNRADVVSFELPQGPKTLDGHQFELRVRLTPMG